MEEGAKLTNLWAPDSNFFWEANKTVNKLCSFSLSWIRRGETDILQLLDLETSFSQENAAGHTSLPGNLSLGEQRLKISFINARRRKILIFHSYLQLFISYLKYSNLASSMGCLQSICLNASAHLKLKCDRSKIKNGIRYRIENQKIIPAKPKHQSFWAAEIGRLN